MVVGGAVIPEAQGWLADRFGYQPSFLLIVACYAYIPFFALYGHRLRVVVEPVIEPAVLLERACFQTGIRTPLSRLPIRYPAAL